jgi:hypothetical protein
LLASFGKNYARSIEDIAPGGSLPRVHAKDWRDQTITIESVMVARKVKQKVRNPGRAAYCLTNVGARLLMMALFQNQPK